MIYLDFAATTPVAPEVTTTIHEALQYQFANPSSIYQAGKKTKQLMTQARAQLKNLLDVTKDGQIYFTSGATEANNWALISQAMTARAKGYGQHIVSTAIEHPSVLNVLKYLETQGFNVTYLNPIAEKYSVEQFVEVTTANTIGWVAMAVNNEVGTQLPIQALSAKARQLVKWFHVDCVQLFHQGLHSLSELGATSYAISGHKLYAPKGIGLLLYQPWDNDLPLQSLIHGGGQEFKLRAGTENVPYILGLAKAFELLATQTPVQSEVLTNHLLAQLTEHQIEFERNGQDTVPYIINLYFPKLLASQILIQMDLAGIAISAGSACSAGSLEVSHVLKAYYPQNTNRQTKSIRISLGHMTTQADIDAFVKQLIILSERTEKLWHSQQTQL